MSAPSDPLPADSVPLDDEESVLAVAMALHAGRGADDPALRQLLAEVAEDVAEARARPEAANPHVRAAALARYADAPTPAESAMVGPATGLANSGRPRPVPLAARFPSRRRWNWGLKVAAAVLLVLGAAGVLSRGPEAEARLRLVGLDRVGLDDGRPELGSGRLLALGDRVLAAPRERVAIRLSSDSAVLLAESSAVTVVAGTEAGPIEARLRLDSGEVRLRSGSRPVTLDLGEAGRLIVLDGDACVRRTPGDDARGLAAAIEVLASARARLWSPEGRQTPLEGPVRATLGGGPGGGLRLERDAPAACRGLAFFGPARSTRSLGRFPVAAPRWRVRSGPGERRGTRLHLGPPSGREESARIRVAWRPSPSVRKAIRLRISLDTSAPIEAGLEGFDVSSAVEAGTRFLDLPLPDGWYEQLDGGEIVLWFGWPPVPGPRAKLAFDGATFADHLPATRDRAGTRSVR